MDLHAGHPRVRPHSGPSRVARQPGPVPSSRGHGPLRHRPGQRADPLRDPHAGAQPPAPGGPGDRGGARRRWSVPRSSRARPPTCWCWATVRWATWRRSTTSGSSSRAERSSQAPAASLQWLSEAVAPLLAALASMSPTGSSTVTVRPGMLHQPQRLPARHGLVEQQAHAAPGRRAERQPLVGHRDVRSDRPQRLIRPGLLRALGCCSTSVRTRHGPNRTSQPIRRRSRHHERAGRDAHSHRMRR